MIYIIHMISLLILNNILKFACHATRFSARLVFLALNVWDEDTGASTLCPLLHTLTSASSQLCYNNVKSSDVYILSCKPIFPALTTY